jgi:hypothetical protein
MMVLEKQLQDIIRYTNELENRGHNVPSAFYPPSLKQLTVFFPPQLPSAP